MKPYKQPPKADVAPSMTDNLTEILNALTVISHQLSEVCEMYTVFATRGLQMMKENCPCQEDIKENMQ